MRSTAALALALLLALPSIAAEPQAVRVKYLGGPAAFGDYVTLSFTDDTLVLAGKSWGGKQQITFSIPLSEINSVVHSPVRFGRQRQVGSVLPSPLSGGSPGGPGAGGYALLYLLTLGIGNTMHGQSHYISIIWAHEGVEQEFLIEPGKNSYDGLLQQFAKHNPEKLLDLSAQCKKVEDELSRNKTKAFSAVIDRHVKLGDADLAPGPYKLIVLERAEGTGELYFFAGEVRNDLLRGIAPVQITLSGGTPEVIYAPDTKPARIMQVKTSGRTLLLP